MDMEKILAINFKMNFRHDRKSFYHQFYVDINVLGTLWLLTHHNGMAFQI